MSEESVGFVVQAELELFEHLLVTALERLHKEQDLDLVLLRILTAAPSRHHRLQDLIRRVVLGKGVRVVDFLGTRVIRRGKTVFIQQDIHLVHYINIVDYLFELRLNSLESASSIVESGKQLPYGIQSHSHQIHQAWLLLRLLIYVHLDVH